MSKSYLCNTPPIRGKRYGKVMPIAQAFLNELERRTKRRPYVRSAYFGKEKIFFDYFWAHLRKKSLHDRARRMKYLPCALELIQKTKHDPITYIDQANPNSIKHQFNGLTSDGTSFVVIIKDDRRSGMKQFLSIFPKKNTAQ